MKRDPIWWVLVAGVVVAFVAITTWAVAFRENPETNPFTHMVESRCGSEVTDWQHISTGGYYVHEMADGTYAIHENSWPNANPPRPHFTMCDVGQGYWDDPNSWTFTGEG